MNEGFISFKKKILKRHLIIDILLSISIFLIIFGILFLLTKLNTIKLNVIVDLIIGLICGITTFLISFFLFKPNDKKIAKMLDKQFSLNEKVQTMVELKDTDNFIANLQREDCENKLKEIPLKNLKFKVPVVLIILALCGVTSTVTAAAIPQTTTIKDTTYNPTNDILVKLEQLKKDVNNTNINSSLKSNYVAEIDKLIELIQSGIDESNLNTNVLNTIDNVLVLNKNYCTNKSFGKAMNAIEDVEYSDSFTNRTNLFYGTWKSKGENKSTIRISQTAIEVRNTSYALDDDTQKNIAKLEEITAILPEDSTQTVTVKLDKGNNCIVYNNTSYYLVEDFTYYKAIGRNIYNYENNIANLISFLSQDYETMYSNGASFLIKRIKEEITSLNKVLEASSLNDTNSYYNALNEFINAMQTATTSGTGKLKNNINKALENLQSALVEKLDDEINSYNCADMINTRLREIFSLPQKEEDSDKLKNEEDDSKIDNSSSGSGDSDTDQTEYSGGKGAGDPVYASDDPFFSLNSDGEPEFADNDKGLYVYSHFYAEYQALYLNLKNDGTLTDEEIVEYLNTYFDKLVNGLKNNN